MTGIFSQPGNLYSSGQFENLPSTPVAGQIYCATNIGQTGAKLRYTGAVWVLDGECLLKYSATASPTLVQGTTEQIVVTADIPAGLLNYVRQIRITALWAKSATAETGTLKVWHGVNGTAADTRIVNQVVVAAGNRSYAQETLLLAVSPSTMRISGLQSGTVGWLGGTATVVAAAASVAPFASASKLSFGASLSAATETLTLDHYSIILS